MSCCNARESSDGSEKIIFITQSNLKTHLEYKVNPVAVIDCRIGADEKATEKSYNDHHIPGAHYMNMRQWLNFS